MILAAISFSAAAVRVLDQTTGQSNGYHHRAFSRTITAAISPSSARINGRTIFGCPILSRCSSVRRAEQGGPISGPTLIGTLSQRPARLEPCTRSAKSLKKNLGANAGLTIIRHDTGLERAARRATLSGRHTSAPAKPPAQPVGMAESDMNKSSWQKPARTEPARDSCGVRSRVQMKNPPGANWRAHRFFPWLAHKQAKARPSAPGFSFACR